MTLAQAIYQVNFSASSRSELIAYIFNNNSLKNVVRQYIKNNGGSDEDANLIYSDMIVQFVKTCFGPKAHTEVNGDLEPYLVGIARYLWLAEIKRKGKGKEFTELNEANIQMSPSPESLFITHEKNLLLHNILDKLRSNCRAVLMHWANGFSMQEIANQLGYQSEGMARKKKSQCFAELNDFLMQNPHFKLQLIQ